VDAVRTEGDSAVKAYTAKFDRVDLNEACCPIEVRFFNVKDRMLQ